MTDVAIVLRHAVNNLYYCVWHLAIVIAEASLTSCLILSCLTGSLTFGGICFVAENCLRKLIYLLFWRLQERNISAHNLLENHIMPLFRS